MIGPKTEGTIPGRFLKILSLKSAFVGKWWSA